MVSDTERDSSSRFSTAGIIAKSVLLAMALTAAAWQFADYLFNHYAGG